MRFLTPFCSWVAILYLCLAGTAQAEENIADLVKGKLFTLHGGTRQKLEDTALDDIQYIALYYSAGWCPPCHRFTPDLVTFYNDFKPSHANFELIFVSEDYDGPAMLNYMKEMSMPWPAVRYESLRHRGNGFKGPGIDSFAGNGIPDLVLVDASGKVLSDSYEGSTYVGPLKVIEDIKTMVK